VLTASSVVTLLGVPRFHLPSEKVAKPEVGTATGLAWTEAGGEILSIEATLMRGRGQLTLTGQMGDVMQESAQAAMSYIRNRGEALGIDPNFRRKFDIHVHIPEGAIPKDGPSAGIAMATALASLLSGIPVRGDVAMTGEVTLRGKVLPIGGVKEKVLAAYRVGIKTVLLPRENEKDLEEIPADISDKMEFLLVENMDDVLEAALAGRAPAGDPSRRPASEDVGTPPAGESMTH
jgi:ATP-dependent Lon protease